MHNTRFAPSPTGFLHLGHAFAAITAYEAAQGGAFHLRIEDLDQSRARPEYEVAIEQDLSWLGLRWQRPVLRQSTRLTAYGHALGQLRDLGLLYPCFCTRREIQAEIARASEAPHEPDHGVYPGTCRKLPAAERERALARAQPHVMRLDAAKAAAQTATLTFTELGIGPAGEHGAIQVDATLLGDVVLARKDIACAYHLAVVVDDAFQGISLVTRGNDLFPATHVQRLLQALLGLPVPLYAHHRLLLDPDGRKFSKRNQAVTLRSVRDQGMDVSQIRRTLGLD